MQASTWIYTYQMQATKFMSLLPLLVCSSRPRVLILLIHVHDRTLISSPPLSSKDNSYLCAFLSPFVINDHKKDRSHMKFAMWRSMATTWSCTSCTCRITTWIPLVGNHMKHLWFESWIFIFLMDTFNLIEIDTTYNNNMWKHEDHIEMPHVGY